MARSVSGIEGAKGTDDSVAPMTKGLRWALMTVRREDTKAGRHRGLSKYRDCKAAKLRVNETGSETVKYRRHRWYRRHL